MELYTVKGAYQEHQGNPTTDTRHFRLTPRWHSEEVCVCLSMACLSGRATAAELVREPIHCHVV